MYKLQFSLVPTYPNPNLPSIVLEEHLACLRCGLFFCEGSCAATGSGPVFYQPEGMNYQQRQPSSGSGPSRIQSLIESRQTEALYNNPNTRESSGPVLLEDGSIGFHPGPGQAWIKGNDNTGVGQQMPYDRPGDHTDSIMMDRGIEDPQMFVVPITDPLEEGNTTSTAHRFGRSNRRGSTSGNRSNQWLHRRSRFEVAMADLPSRGAIADGSNAIPTPTVPSVSEPMWNPSLYAEASRSILEERHEPIEVEDEEEFDTVSLGSE